MEPIPPYLPTPPAYTYQSISANQIIVEAFQKLGIQPAVITNNDLVIALSSLNFILQSWTNRGVRIWKLKSGMITLVPGQISYSLPQTINQTPNVYASSSLDQSFLTNIPVPILQGQTIPYILDFYDMSVRYGQNIQNTVTLNNNTSLNVSLTTPPAWPQIIGVYSPSDSIYQLTVYALLPTAISVYQDTTPQAYLSGIPYNFQPSPTSAPVSSLTITTSSEIFLDGMTVGLKDGSLTVPCTISTFSPTALTVNVTAGVSPLTSFSFSFPENYIYQDTTPQAYISGAPYNFQPSPTSTSIGTLTITTSTGTFPDDIVFSLTNGGTNVPCTISTSPTALIANITSGSSLLTSFSFTLPASPIYQDESSQSYVSGIQHNFESVPTVSNLTITTSTGIFLSDIVVGLNNGDTIVPCTTTVSSNTSLIVDMKSGSSPLTSFAFLMNDLTIYQDESSQTYSTGAQHNFEPFPTGTFVTTLAITTSIGSFFSGTVVTLTNGDTSVPCTTNLSSNTLTANITSGNSQLTGFSFTLPAINIYQDSTPQIYVSGTQYNFSPSPTSTPVKTLTITTSTGTFPTGTTVGLFDGDTTVPCTTALNSGILTATVTSGSSTLTNFIINFTFPNVTIYQDSTPQSYVTDEPYNFSPSPTSTAVSSLTILTATGTFLSNVGVNLVYNGENIPCTTSLSSNTLTVNVTSGASFLTSFYFTFPELTLYQDSTPQAYSNGAQYDFNPSPTSAPVEILVITTSTGTFPDNIVVSLNDGETTVPCTTVEISDTSLRVTVTSGSSPLTSFGFTFPDVTIFQDETPHVYNNNTLYYFEPSPTSNSVGTLTVTTSEGTFPTGTTVGLFDGDTTVPCTTSLSSNTLTVDVKSGSSTLTNFGISFPETNIYQDESPQIYNSDTQFDFDPSPTSTPVKTLTITTSTGTFPTGTTVGLFDGDTTVPCTTSFDFDLDTSLTVTITAGSSTLTTFSLVIPTINIYQDSTPQAYSNGAQYDFNPSPTSAPVSSLVITTSTGSGTFPNDIVVSLNNGGTTVPCTTSLSSNTLTVDVTSGSSILTNFGFTFPAINIYQDSAPQIYPGTPDTLYNFNPSPTATPVGNLTITTSTGTFLPGTAVSLFSSAGHDLFTTTTINSPTSLTVNITTPSSGTSQLDSFAIAFNGIVLYEDESPNNYISNIQSNFSPSPTVGPVSSLSVTTNTGAFNSLTSVFLYLHGNKITSGTTYNSPTSLTLNISGSPTLLTSFSFQIRNVTIYQDSISQLYVSNTQYDFESATPVTELTITTSTGAFLSGIQVTLWNNGTSVPCTTSVNTSASLFVSVTSGVSQVTSFALVLNASTTYELTIVSTPPIEIYELFISSVPVPTYELSITAEPVETYELTIDALPVPTYELSITAPPVETYALIITVPPPVETYALTITTDPVPTYELFITAAPVPTYELSITAPPIPTYQLAITAPPIPTYEVTITAPPVEDYQLAITAPPIPTYQLAITAPLIATVYQDFAPQYYGSPGLFFELSTQYQQVSSLIINTNSSYPFTQTPIVKLLTNVVDNKMTRIGYDDWQNISNKMSQGTPTSYYVDRQINPIWYPWMVPTSRTPSNYFAFKYLGYQAFQDITNLATIPDIVPRFYLAVIYQLAVDLALKRTMTDLIQILGAQAQQEFILASKEDSDKSSFSIDMDYSRNTR